MDLETKTKIAQELLGLPEAHDCRTLFDALQPLLKLGARDGIGNALADLQERVAHLYAPEQRSAWHGTAYSDPRAAAHVATVRWLTAGLIDLREVADLVAGSQERHDVLDALRCLQVWVEEES
jgi:hypothetical protein